MRKVRIMSEASRKFSAKLASKFEGSYEIIQIRSPSVYISIQRKRVHRSITKEHISELKRYVLSRQLRVATELIIISFVQMESTSDTMETKIEVEFALSVDWQRKLGKAIRYSAILEHTPQSKSQQPFMSEETDWKRGGGNEMRDCAYEDGYGNGRSEG